MVEHCGVNKRKLVEAETCRSYEVTSDNSTSQIPATKALCEVSLYYIITFESSSRNTRFFGGGGM